MKFFVDNNLPPALARVLHALSEPRGHRVVHLREKFEQDAKDEIWIKAPSKEGGWSVVTHDRLNKGSVSPAGNLYLKRSRRFASFCIE